MVGALGVVVEWPDAASGLNPVGGFDSHDGRAEVGHGAGRRRTGHNPHQVEHLDAGQRAFGWDRGYVRERRGHLDHPSFSEVMEGVGVESKFAVDFRVVLAE